MTVTVRKLDHATVLDLEGMLDQGNAVQSLLVSIEEQLGAGAKNLAINLAAVPMLDSSGVGTLLRVHTTAEEAGKKLVLFNINPQIKKSLQRVRLDTVLCLAEDEASALASLK
jgi:anti-anti-sigma factor